MEMLWHFTAQYCPRGDIGRYTDDEIAEACAWPEERPSRELIETLIECRLLDAHPEYRLVVHDWADHAEDSVHTRLARAGESFADGRPPRSSRLAKSDRRAHAERTDDTRRAHAVRMPSAQHAHAERTESAQCAHCHSHSRSHSRSHSHSHSQAVADAKPQPLPEPEPEPQQAEPTAPDPDQQTASSALDAEKRNNGSRIGRHLDWIAAVEQEISAAVGRPPRPGSALTLARQAASMGVHPRYVLGWIQSRARASPPRSDGLFLKAIADLPDWVRRNHAHDSRWDLREAVACPRCGETVYAFRDVIVPCRCETDRSGAPTMRQAAEVKSMEFIREHEITEVAARDASEEQI
jgi:hypothetical protein